MKLKGFRLGILHWNDATNYESAALKTVKEGLTSSCSIGFIQRQREGFLVVHGVQGGDLKDFICIPKQWAQKITWLCPKKARKRKEACHVEP